MATVQQMKRRRARKAARGPPGQRVAPAMCRCHLRREQAPDHGGHRHAELRRRIDAGRFLTTLYEIDVDGQKHRVIPRDFQLDAIKTCR